MGSRLLGIIAGLTGPGRTITLPKSYVEWMNGDYVAAVVLNDIAYFTHWSEDRGTDGWFYRTESDWQEACSLSRKQVTRAISDINTRAKSSLILQEVRPQGMGRATFYKLNMEAFHEVLKTMGVLPKGTDGSCREGRMGVALRDGPLNKELTETTTETTTDTSAFANAGVRNSPKQTRRKFDPERVYADPLWQRFWDAYPRKIDKADAAKVWASMSVDASLVDRMTATLAWQWTKLGWNAAEDQRIIPYPSTWLNGRRWEDEKPQATNGNGHDADTALDPKARAMARGATYDAFGVLVMPDGTVLNDDGSVAYGTDDFAEVARKRGTKPREYEPIPLVAPNRRNTPAEAKR